MAPRRSSSSRSISEVKRRRSRGDGSRTSAYTCSCSIAAINSCTFQNQPRRRHDSSVIFMHCFDVILEDLGQLLRQRACRRSRRCSPRCAQTIGCRSWSSQSSTSTPSTTIVLWCSSVRVVFEDLDAGFEQPPVEPHGVLARQPVLVGIARHHDADVDAALACASMQRVERRRIGHEVRDWRCRSTCRAPTRSTGNTSCARSRRRSPAS